MKIDAEIYFWKNENQFSHPLIRENKILRKQYLPEQVSQNLQRNGIGGCIATTAEEAEVQTRFLAELALTHPEILGVVGNIDLYGPQSVKKIEEFQQYTFIKGYRMEAGRMDSIQPSTMEILLTHSYCLDLSLGNEKEISKLKNWIGSHPGQTFILRDAGNADAKLEPSKNWESNIRELAIHQNVSCKLSGLFTKANHKNWKPADFYPFLGILFDAFGSDRLLFASEWPFLLLSGAYVQWKSLIEKFMERLLPEDREKVFGDNVRRLYHI